MTGLYSWAKTWPQSEVRQDESRHRRYFHSEKQPRRFADSWTWSIIYCRVDSGEMRGSVGNLTP
jgi:hypothetical protein